MAVLDDLQGLLKTKCFSYSCPFYLSPCCPWILTFYFNLVQLSSPTLSTVQIIQDLAQILKKIHSNNSASWIHTGLQYRNFTTVAKRIISITPFKEFQTLLPDDLFPSPEVDLYVHMAVSMFLLVNRVPVLNTKATHLPLSVSLLQFH